MANKMISFVAAISLGAAAIGLASCSPDVSAKTETVAKAAKEPSSLVLSGKDGAAFNVLTVDVTKPLVWDDIKSGLTLTKDGKDASNLLDLSHAEVTIGLFSHSNDDLEKLGAEGYVYDLQDVDAGYVLGNVVVSDGQGNASNAVDFKAVFAQTNPIAFEGLNADGRSAKGIVTIVYPDVSGARLAVSKDGADVAIQPEHVFDHSRWAYKATLSEKGSYQVTFGPDFLARSTSYEFVID